MKEMEGKRVERIDSVRVQQKVAEKLGVDGDAIAIQRISLFRASKKIEREREREEGVCTAEWEEKLGSQFNLGLF